MNKKNNNRLNKLIKKCIKFYHANSEKLPQLSHDDYRLLSEFNSLMELVNIVLLLANESDEDERYCVMHLLSHGLIQYQVEYENSVTHKADFTLAQSIESLISRQLASFDLNGFFVAREVINALFSANISVDEAFLNQLNNAEYFCDAEQKVYPEVGFEDLVSQFEQLVEAFAANSDYEIYLQIAEQLNQMPAEAGQLMFNSMLQTKSRTARDAALLLLLHPLAKVRNNILDGLYLFAEQRLLNARDYNRLLVIRNWVGHYEKKIIDDAIKLMQKAQISFEHNVIADKKKIHKILLTPTDNGGCMALQIAFKQANQFIVFGCVLKQDYGIKDVFITDFLDKSSYQQLLLEASNGLPMCSINFDQFEYLINHFLKLNLVKTNSIPAEILLLKEYTGADWLHPQAIPLSFVETYLKNAKKNSPTTFCIEDFIIGWASPDYLASHQSVNEIIKQEFEPARLNWYERLKLTCFCFVEHIDNINLFLESAQQIKADKKLTKIKLFQEIGKQILADDYYQEEEFDFLPDNLSELIDEELLNALISGEVELTSKELAKILNQTNQIKFENSSREKRAVYQLKISLTATKPLIWRRVIVMNTISLRKLHTIIQIVMGWQDQPMYAFEFDNCLFGRPENYAPNIYNTSDFYNDSQVQLRDLLTEEKSKLNYIYNFVDCWKHTVILEKILPAQKKNTPIQLLKAVGVCMMENVDDFNIAPDLLAINGGLAINDGQNSTPGKFDLIRINKILAEL